MDTLLSELIEKIFLSDSTLLFSQFYAINKHYYNACRETIKHTNNIYDCLVKSSQITNAERWTYKMYSVGLVIPPSLRHTHNRIFVSICHMNEAVRLYSDSIDKMMRHNAISLWKVARMGQVDILAYIYQNHRPFISSSPTFYYAAFETDMANVIYWYYTTDYWPCLLADSDVAVMAAYSGATSCLIILHKYGYQHWSDDVLSMATYTGESKCIEWLKNTIYIDQ